MRRVALALGAPLVAILSALALGSVMVLLYRQSPAHVWAMLVRGTLGVAYGFGQVLFKATPLMCTGLAVALPLRAGLFNIGAEGQMLVGGFVAAVLSAHFSAVPAPVAAPLAVLAALAGGAGYAAVPGLLKARTGAHEVITTIMLNFIAAALTGLCGVRLGLYMRESEHTAYVAPSAHLPRLSVLFPALHGSALNVCFVLALIACVAVAWLLYRTRFGYEVRAVGLAPRAAETAHISIERTQFTAFTLAGALAGLGGANFVLGYKYYFEEGFSSRVGFMGIAVALLARRSPLAIIPAALFFGILSQGGLVVNFLVPKEIVDVLQAVVIIAVAVASERAMSRAAGEGA
jgi:simple sugar transport system permease protein